jgi:hypothetical protein
MDSENVRLAVELRDRLLAELRNNPLFRAYLSAQETVAALSAGASLGTPREQTTRGESARQKSPSKPGTQTETIVTAAAVYLREKNARAPSGEISRALQAHGISVGGKDPSATVAAYLTHSPLFDNIRGEGYGLVEWSSQIQTETPNSGTLFGAPKGNGSSPLSP